MNSSSRIYRLTESALLIAVAAVLSVLKIVDMPAGGSVTACSMLPLLLVSYRHGTKWGLFTAFTYGLIQLLLGLDNFSYATSFGAVVAIALFDYLLAFLALGLGGLFRKKLPQSAALAWAAVVAGVARYLCHVISGCTVWAGLSIPTAEALTYSLSYNATYMLPEVLVLVVGIVTLSRLISFEGTSIARAARIRTATPLAGTLSVIAKLVLLGVLAGLIVYVAPFLQLNEELWVGLSAVNWLAVLLVAVGGGVLCAVLEVISACLSKRQAK